MPHWFRPVGLFFLMKNHYIFAMAETPVAPRSFKIYGAVYTEFGKLARVENDHGWIHLFNEDGTYVSMKKVYARWASVFLTAQKLIGKEIIIETGSSSSHTDYFRDVVPENDSPEYFGRIFDNLPTNKSVPNSDNPLKIKAEIIRLRIYKNRFHFQAKELLEQKTQLTSALEQLTAAEQKEADKAAEQLDEQWQSFMENPSRSLIIAGQAINASRFPKKIDISFAMRLGIDLTKKRRINVKVEEKIKGKNKIKCVLPDYDNTECVIAIKQSDVNSTRGEWAAVTVENTLPGWWPIEDTKYRDVKNHRKDIDYFIDVHNQILFDLL